MLDRLCAFFLYALIFSSRLRKAGAVLMGLAWYAMSFREKLHTANHVFTERGFNRRFLRDLYPSDFGSFEAKLHVHYLGLDLENFLYAPTGRPGNQVIGVGRLCKAKGYEFLLKALALPEARGIYLECDLYGDGPERRGLIAGLRLLSCGHIE